MCIRDSIIRIFLGFFKLEIFGYEFLGLRELWKFFPKVSFFVWRTKMSNENQLSEIQSKIEGRGAEKRTTINQLEKLNRISNRLSLIHIS
ncbi:hypothetical protein CGC27_05135, partial [Enterococcus faecium]